MKKHFHILLLTALSWTFCLNNTHAQAEAYIVGPSSLCFGECGTFEVFLFDSTDFIVQANWNLSNGTTLTGNPVTICMDNPNGMVITVSGFTEFQLDFFTEYFVEPSGSINPVIVSTSAQCPDSLSSCDKVCAFNTAVYEATGVSPGTSVSWQVFGAENFEEDGNTVTVEWGAAGQGEVSVFAGGPSTLQEPLQIFCGMTNFSITNPAGVPGDGYLNIEGGLAPYTVFLSSSTLTSTTVTNDDMTFPALMPDTYFVQVTDANGEVANCQFTIPNNPDECWMNVNPTQTVHPSGCNACDGSIELEIFPNAGNVVTYLWSDGSTEMNPTGLCPGTYSVTVVDAFDCLDIIDVILACPDSSFCSGESSLCVEILEEPKAQIGATPAVVNDVIEICQGQTVYFENESENATTYIWDFGDLNTSTQFEPEHTYPTPGVYNVSLIARNECYCNDTTFVEVNVLPADVPEISCVGTICEGETVTYATEVMCGTYNWNVIGGGTVIDGGGTDDNFVTVEWNSGPEGAISLSVSGCAGSVCTTPNIVLIPIVSESAQIQGRTAVCEGSTEEYFIPNYQGTEINWVVDGSGNIVSGQGTERVTVHWFGSANLNNPQQVIVSFNNCYLDCEGRDTLDVNIVPSFYVKGPIEVCEKTIEDYSSYNSISNALVSMNWQVVDAGGTTVWSTLGTNTASVDWDLPVGDYIVRARPNVLGDFCNNEYEIFVEVVAAPPLVNNIIGEDEICPSENYSYEADGIPINDFTWTVTGGTPNDFKGNPVNIVWGATPPYELAVTQTATTGLACTSEPISINPDEIPTVTVIGVDQVCMEETETYTVPFFEKVYYDWVITPADRGTVVSGQGTPNVEVLWHEAGSADLDVFICGIVQTYNVTVLPLPEPVVIHPDEICTGETASVQTTIVYNSYRWLDADGLLVSIDAMPDLVGGYYELEVVDQNGCVGRTSFDIFELPEPSITISVPIYSGICPGGPSVTITASTTTDGYDYQWFEDGIPSPINSPFFVTTTGGTYSVIVTDQNGCTNESNTLIIVDCEQAGGQCVNGICVGGQCNNPNGCNLDGAISFDIVKTNDCYTHEYVNTSTNDIAGSWGWIFGDPDSGPDNTSNLENPSHTFSHVGFYSIIFTGEVPEFGTGNTCPDGILQQDTILVVADFEYESACPGIPVEFTDLTEILPYASITDWAWDFGDPSSGADNTSTDQHPSHIYSATGNYVVTLTVTEADGCQTGITKNIEVFDSPTASFAIPSVTCENTALPFSAIAPADVVDVTWDFGDPASGPANLATKMDTHHEYSVPGIYTVTLTVTNIFGCSFSFSDNITVTPNTLGGVIAYSQPSPICEGDQITLTAPTGGIDYIWSDNNPTNQITTGTAGVYDVTLTDADGCTFSPADAVIDVYGEPNGIIKAVEYNEFGQPVAFFENNHTVCEGEDVSLVIQGSLDYSYEWSDGNGMDDEIEFTEDRDNLLTVGVHNFTVTITDNTTGCTSEEGPFTVTVNPKPDVQISSMPSGFLCENVPATLSIVSPDPSLTYGWNTGEMGNSINVIAGGTYFVQAVNQFGCKSRSNEVVVNNAPDIDAIPSGCHTRCAPDTMCLPNMPLVSNYQWFYNNTPMTAPNGNLAEPIFDQSGEYFVQMTDIYGCKSASDVLTLDLYPGFGDVLGDVYFDVNQNGIIDAADTLVSGITIYLNDNTGTIDSVMSDQNGYVFIDILSENYTMVLDTANLPAGWLAYNVDSLINLVGCDVEEQLDWLLTDQCIPESYTENFDACTGDGVMFDGTFVPAGDTEVFTYENAEGCDSTITVIVDALPIETSQLQLGACTGTTVEYEGVDLSPNDTQDFTLADANGCDSIVQVTVEEWLTYSLPLPLTVCENSSVQYGGQTLFPGDTQDFMFTTSDGCDSIMQVTVSAAQIDTTALPLEVCLGETIEYNGQQLEAGDQMEFLMVNQYGCDSLVEVSVTPFAPVTYDLDAGEICWNGTDGEIEVQNISGGAGPYLVSLDGIDYQPLMTFENLTAGDYTVYLLDDEGCQYTESIEVPMVEPMLVQVEDEMMECGDELTLAPFVISEIPFTLAWENGSTDSALLINTPGVYNFTATNICESVNETINVGLGAVGLDGLIYMPNSFSPNGDGMNDCYQGFVAPDVNVEYFIIRIFDRWGNIMFESYDPSVCWNGEFKGKMMQPAVFGWFMELRARNCDGSLLEVFEEGDIHLIR